MLCPICAEVMDDDQESQSHRLHVLSAAIADCCRRPGRRHRRLTRPCCGQSICQSCLYRHIRSVWDEGMTGSGRKQLVCPVGCGHAISDADIRACLHLQHFHVIWNWFCILIKLLAQFFVCIGLGWVEKPRETSEYYQFWLSFSTTTAEQHDLELYENWSLAVAFRNMTPAIQHCPAPDCNYAWQLSNPEHRKGKFQHDRRPVYLWYKPPPPEPEVQITTRATGTTNNSWIHAAYVNTLHGGPPPLNDEAIQEEMNRDGRLMICAKCHTTFCGLCRRPWNDVNSNNRKRQFSHSRVSCATYRQRNPLVDDEYAFACQVSNARMCPGCSVRTSRTDGCNHMTCPCGVEWCYICEQPWSSSHYSCVDRPTTSTPTGTMSECIIL